MLQVKKMPFEHSFKILHGTCTSLHLQGRANKQTQNRYLNKNNKKGLAHVYDGCGHRGSLNIYNF